MAAITYGVATPVRVASEKRKNFLVRCYEALVEARMHQAEREIKLYHHLLPADYEIAGDKITSRNEDSLPFMR